MNAATHNPGHVHTRDETKDEGPLPFFGPVSRQNPVRAAHGNVRVRHWCRCGAHRDILVNGHHVERGPWIEAEGGR